MTEPPAAVEPIRGLEALVSEHRDRLLRLCRMVLADGSDAEEVVQDVFLKAWGAARGSDPPVDWARWLTRVAVNACRDRTRTGWWKRFRRHTDPLEDVTLRALAPSPEDTAIGGEIRQRLWDAFHKLSERQREVFVLRYVEGWSTEEAAAALGLTTGTAKRHLFRAIRHLRDTLGDAR